MTYLVDTNIFLEILLVQDRREDCKRFLNDNIGKLSISDFSLHSIGVILFRNNNAASFERFARDVLKRMEIVSLDKALYNEIPSMSKQLGLDFDDTYQCAVAKQKGLTIVTMDTDFNKAVQTNKIDFL